MIATVMERSIRSEKTFHVYDTFKGLPGSDYQPELDDLKGLFIGTLEQFRNKIGSFRFTEARPGFVPKSLPNDDINIYDFVHLDMDLYEGTLGAMEHFFPRLRKGGIIHIDDYNINPWDGVNDAVDEYLSHQSPANYFIQTIPLGGAYVLKL